MNSTEMPSCSRRMRPASSEDLALHRHVQRGGRFVA